jgi:very-short-patch-repair endonuclease
VIEVDGPIHQYQEEEDSIRQEYLESHGLKIFRFSNHFVLNEVDEVIRQILAILP